MAIGGFTAPQYGQGPNPLEPGEGVGHAGAGNVTGSSPGFNPVTGQSYSFGVQGPVLTFGLTKLPPGPCELAYALLPADYDGSDQDVDRALAALPVLSRGRILRAQQAWANRYPQAPPAPIVITSEAGGGSAQSNVVNLQWGVACTRPTTDYDPELDILGAPVIPIGDPNRPDAIKFQAALRLFFPDFVLDSQTGAQLTGPQVGSMTIYGPFPRRVNYVSGAMVDLAVAVAQMPGAFQAGMVGGSSGPDFIGALKVGAQATVASKNVYVGAGAAAARFIISAFDWIFSGPPQQPAWLTALEQMKELRGDTTAEGGWSFTSARFGVSGTHTSPWPCSIAGVHPNPRGTMTIEEGYDAFIARITGGSGRVPWLLLAALGAGAILLTRE
jgi:hypothetical protein